MSLMVPPPSEEQLRDIIQGPSEVEWRSVLLRLIGRCARRLLIGWLLACRYEMRRECQEILPNVFLGPFQASKSLETLKHLGITHVFVVQLLVLTSLCSSKTFDFDTFQCLHSRREGGVLGQTAIPRSLYLPGAGRSGQRGAEPHQLVSQVSCETTGHSCVRGWI